MEAMCTLPVAGATEVSSALTGPVLQRPAATTSTPATAALVRKVLVARRRDLFGLDVPIDLMFVRYLPGGPANDLVDLCCQYFGYRSAAVLPSHIGGCLGLAERYRTTLREQERGPNGPLPVERSPMSSYGDHSYGRTVSDGD
jgi:hypothetical protein